MQTRLSLVLLLALTLGAPGVQASLEKQRELFLDAEKALGAKQHDEYRRIKSQLDDYPLLDYLEYWELRRRLHKASAEDVRAFLDTYRNTPLAGRLRISWLHKLGKRKDWATFREFYTPQKSVTLQCYWVRARLQQGEREQALADALELWLVGHSQPDACDPAFKQLYSSSLITSDLIWQRIRLAFAEQKSSLAGFLARRLSSEDRTWVQRWQYAHKRPTAAIKQPWAREDSPLVREILTHALRRLARHKPEQAWKHWQRLARSHRFSEQQKGQILQPVALYGALRADDKAGVWLASVPADAANADIRQWRVRTALLEGDWEAALHWIDELTDSERQKDAWRYWRAHALLASGAKGDAFSAYGSLSNERSYYGFLAADQLQRDYQMNDVRVPYSDEQLAAVEQLPGILRARELYFTGKGLEARREWFYATEQLSAHDLRAAAQLAHRWGWHDRAILTASKARYWSDLGLRFPLPHRESIFFNARRYELDPGLIYGVIRQESAFMEDARSPVGALGLMQLMPNTGKQTARALNIRYRGNQALLQSEQNIQLGSAYLNKLMVRYNGSPVLASAAYNAGPNRVSRWLPDEGNMDASLWIERIPFKETRTYVQRVLAYATIFDWRLEQPLTRLSNRLPIVRQRY